MNDKCNCQNVMHECDESNGCKIISRLTAPQPCPKCEPVGYFFKNDRGFWHQAGDLVGFKGLTKLYTTPQPCPDCLKWATDMSQVTQTLRYLIGIAERGTATTLPDGVTVESFVLDYVKGLEAKVEQMRKEMKEIDAALSDTRVNLTITASEAITALQAKVSELEQDLQTTSDALGHAESNDRELIEEQQGTIKALNIALGGEESTSTENLIDAHEVDYNEEGLISLCRKLIAENVRMGDTVEFQKAGWSADYDQLTRAESVIEKASEALEWAKCYCSKAIHKVQVQPAALEALAAITEYRDGK